MHPRNRALLSLAVVLASVTLITEPSRSQERANPPDTDAVELECGFCRTNTGGWDTHDWVPLACCEMNSANCYMYPDATQYGNDFSCDYAHRPCTSGE